MTRIPINQVELANEGLQERLQMSTAEIGLAVRTTNCLEEKGIFTVHDLLHTKCEDLLSISNFGEKTLEEVYKSLEGIGFHRPGYRNHSERPEHSGRMPQEIGSLMRGNIPR